MAKSRGENFTNAIVYALSDLLSSQEEIVVDKGLPPPLRERLTLHRVFTPAGRESTAITMPIEVDASVFRRTEPTDAILVSGKTRLKEVFHIGTMWKLLFDMIGDARSLAKWG